MAATSQKNPPQKASEPREGPLVDKRYRLRKGRRLNVPLAIGSAAVLVCISAAGYAWHQHQQAKMNGALRQRATALADEKDWRRAAEYWQRYLWLAPGDVDARMSLIDAVEQGAVTPSDRRRLSLMLHETIGLLPDDREDLRLGLQARIAKNHSDMGNLAGAYRAAHEFLDRKADEVGVETDAMDAVAMRRIRAIAASGLAQSGRPRNATDAPAPTSADRIEISPAQAASMLDEALGDAPGDVHLARVAASFYRSQKDVLNGTDSIRRADEIMDGLVAARPQDADALVARYQYRIQYGLPDAQTDLSSALELAPNHFEGLLSQAGALINASEDFEGSRSLVRQAIKAMPKDSRGYMALAQLEAAQGRWREAADAIKEGRRTIGASDLSMDNLLTYFLFQAGDYEEAEESLKQLEESFQARLPELSVAYRRMMQEQIQLMRARLAVARRDLHDAVVLLKAIVAGSQQGELVQLTQATLQAKELLATVTEQLGYWDVAAGQWLDLANAPSTAAREPNPAVNAAIGQATLRAATTLLAAGQLDAAIQQAEKYMRPPTNAAGKPAWIPMPEACLVLLKAQFKKQMLLAAEDRTWAEFNATLELAKNLDPPRLDACLIEFEYYAALGGDDGKRAAAEALAAGEKQFHENATFWRAAALGYQNLERADDAARALARFDALELNPVRNAALRVLLATRSGDIGGAEKALAEALAEAKGQERTDLELLRVNLLLTQGLAEDAQQAVAGLIESATAPDARLLTAGIEIALRAGAYDVAEKWEGMLAAAVPADDFTPRYFRARRLLDRFGKLSAGERAEVDLLVRDLRNSRPTLGDAVALTGRCAELENNRTKAIDDYELATSLGCSTPGVIERLVALLYAEGRYDVADRYFSRLSDKVQTSAEMESLAIATALRRNDIADAITMARKAVEVHPDDPIRQIWLANLLAHDALSRKAKTEEAEAAFRDTLRQFPKDVRVWSAYINLLHQTRQVDKARQVLEEFAAAIGEGSWDRHFVAARSYQLLGDVPRAIQEAEAACQLKPNHVPGRLLLGKLLMSADVSRAAEEFEKVRKSDPANGEARRHLAILWSASGSNEERQRAMELLEGGSGDDASVEGVADSRLRAALLSRQGRNQDERGKNLTAARKIVEELVQTRGPATEDVDRLLLASICEQEAWLQDNLPLLQSAREQWQQLAGREGAPIGYTVQYADFLLRQLAKSMEFGDPQTVAAWKVLREVIAEDAKGRIVELERLAREPGAAVDAIVLLSCRVRLLHATDQTEAAVSAIADFTERQLPAVETEVGQARAWLAVARLYSSVGAHAEAETWFRRVTQIAPESYVMLVSELAVQGRTDEAIEACLTAMSTNPGDAARAASMLAQLVTSASPETGSAQRVDAVISDALKSHGDDVELLMSVAVLNVTRQNDAEAIRYFRRVAELAPTNVLALNNLATLLAESPTDRREALALVNRAIEASGRQPALLDTLGTIQLRAGKYAEAVASLEEAVAGGGADPRYHFHLAAAYQQAKNLDAARDALVRARQLGLDEAILTQGDQELLLELERGLGPASTSTPVESRTGGPAADASRALRNGELPIAA